MSNLFSNDHITNIHEWFRKPLFINFVRRWHYVCLQSGMYLKWMVSPFLCMPRNRNTLYASYSLVNWSINKMPKCMHRQIPVYSLIPYCFALWWWRGGGGRVLVRIHLYTAGVATNVEHGLESSPPTYIFMWPGFKSWTQVVICMPVWHPCISWFLSFLWVFCCCFSSIHSHIKTEIFFYSNLRNLGATKL